MNIHYYKDYCKECIKSRYRQVSRVFEIGLFLCNALWFIIWCWVGYLFTKDTRAYMREICSILAKKNVLYVKLFQSIAMNANLIDKTLHEELLTYTDNVYWEPSHINWDMVYILESKHDIVFNHGGYKPINTGMISVVFKVTDRNSGEILVVKMKRANIETRLQAAIEEFYALARIASYIPLFKTFQLDKVIEENIRTIRDQTNFEEEIRNMQEVQRNCRAINYIKIPNVKKEYVKYSDNIIVMEFIQGVTVSNVLEEDKTEFSKLLIKFTYINLLIYGAMHADLHAGNVLFIKNENSDQSASLKTRRTPKYQLGVIDFGILIRIGEEFKNQMYDLFSKIQTVPARDFVETAVFIMYDIEPHLDKIGTARYETMIQDPIRVIDKIFYGENDSNLNMLFEIFSILYYIQEYLKQNKVLDSPLELKQEFIKMQTILAMNQGVILRLYGDKCISLINEVFKETFSSASIFFRD